MPPKASSKNANAATLILPGIYLGPASAASSLPFLQSKCITHILSVGHSPQIPSEHQVKHLRLTAKDAVDEDLEPLVDAAMEFLELFWKIGLEDGGNVGGSTQTAKSKAKTIAAAAALATTKQSKTNPQALIHCSQAISRSPSVLAGCLIRAKRMTLHEALGMIIRARPAVCPNPGFVRQLKEIERGLFDGVCSLEEVEELPKRTKERVQLFESVNTDLKDEGVVKS